MRIIKVGLFLSLFIVVTLLVVRFVFLDQLVEYSLQKIGIEGGTVHISRVDWTQIHIDNLEASYQLPNGDTYSIILSDASLRYDLPFILLEGKKGRLTIAEMTVALDHPAQKKAVTPTFPAEIILLKDKLRQKIPLENISVSTLRFQGDFPSHILDKNIQLTGSFADTAIVLEMNTTLIDDTVLRAGLESQDDRHGRLQIERFVHSKSYILAECVLNPESIRGTIDLEVTQLLDFALQTGILATMPEVNGSLRATIDVPLAKNGGNEFSLQATINDLTLLGIAASSATIQLSGNMVGRAVVLNKTSHFKTSNIQLKKISVKELRVGLGGIYTENAGHFSAELAALQQVQMQGIMTEKVNISNVDVSLDTTVQLTAHDDSVIAKTDMFQISSSKISDGKRSFSGEPFVFNDFEMKKLDTELELNSQFSTPAVSVQNRDQLVLLKDIAGSIQLKKGDLVSTFQFAPQTVPGQISGVLKQHLPTSSGNIHLKTSTRINLDDEADSLAGLLSPWDFPFNLDGGKIAFRADGAWSPNAKIQLSLFVSVTKGRGYFKELLFDGLDLRQDLALLPELYSKSEGTVFLQQLIGGIDIHDSQCNVRLLSADSGLLPNVQISDFSTSLFDGVISSKNILYDFNRHDSNFDVIIDDVDLGKLVNLIQMNDLHVTGLLSGIIPVRINEKEISVDDGALYSEKPGGVIQYTPEGVNAAGLTGYALKSVEELQYSELKSTANYFPSGQLDLDISLKGISPGLETSRPVHLNIHAEQNLPDLLRSLRYSKGLTEELESRVKQHYMLP